MSFKYEVTEEQLLVAIAALQKLQDDYPVDATLDKCPETARNIRVLHELKNLESV